MKEVLSRAMAWSVVIDGCPETTWARSVKKLDCWSRVIGRYLIAAQLYSYTARRSLVSRLVLFSLSALRDSCDVVS